MNPPQPFNRAAHQAQTNTPKPSPFERASHASKRLKLMLWGDSGVGKTTLSLQFPRPVVIDMEGGTDLYGDSHQFDVIRTWKATEVMESVQWLATSDHDYETLVIDPITVYWEALQRRWSEIFLTRNRGAKGFKHEFYDFQPKDWLTIKSELKELLRYLSVLDMNVILTARQKPQYADGGFMKVVGDTFDAEKGIPYLMDTVVRLYRDEKGRFMGQVQKDRTGKLPTEDFEIKYSVFTRCFGEDFLAGSDTPVTEGDQ